MVLGSSNLVPLKHFVSASLSLLWFPIWITAQQFILIFLMNWVGNYRDSLIRVLGTFGSRRQEHITPYRMRLVWMLNVTKTDYFASLIIYRFVRMREPPLLRTLFEPYKSDKPTRGPRKDLKVPTVPTDWGLYSFQVKYAKLWNLIPPCIRDLPSYRRFKKSIRLYFHRLENEQ